ncbi:MAG: 2-oxo acid dehydrogenase subunit E2 [Bdellovibrionaceae bacterium]|nr:2-oxo acid dehydrogenase subunit E2 [Pseudobdellovibrionaceae bacterium]
MSFTKLTTNWAARNFWSLNDQMKSEYNVTFVREIDATYLEHHRLEMLRNSAFKPSYTALIVEAAARILREYPLANRRIFKFGPFSKMIQFKETDVTVAVEKDLPDAEAVVLAHTIRRCGDLSSSEITADLKSALQGESDRWTQFQRVLNFLPPFIGRWVLNIASWLPSQWVAQRGGACFVNSPAKYGVDLVVADMLWPLTFSFGEVKKRPFVVGDKVEARLTVSLVMIFDRRVMQGAIAARIFNRFCKLVERSPVANTSANLSLGLPTGHEIEEGPART